MKQTIEIDLQYQLEYMDEADLLHAWHIRCDELEYHDDEIFPMDEFDELMAHWKPMDIAFRTFYGGFHPHDDFFSFDGYGNIESHRLLTHWINMDDLADEIMDNDDLADALINAGILEEWRDEDE